MATRVLQPLKPFQYIRGGGNHFWFSEEPIKVQDRSPDPVYLVNAMSPVDAEFKVPPHFHPRASEWMRCVSGELHLTLDGREVTLRPEDGELKISKGVVHAVFSPKGEHAEFQERTDLEPVRKRDLVRNLFLLSDKSFMVIQALTLFYEEGDSYPADISKSIGRLLVWILGGFFGSFLGLGKRE